MTLTIGARWCVSVHVQPITRMALPARSQAAARTGPDLDAIMQANALRADLAEQRRQWEMEALFCARRMY